jgi:phosphatidylserine/phosphatidylglycerophosphate/cardiolipin synthase-like enzyme
LPVQKEYGEALVRVVGSTPGQNNRITFIVYVSAITFAEHSIHLTNAYFIPDDQVLDAIVDAAKRGVDVKIILSREFAGKMEQMFAGDLVESIEIKLEKWEKRSLLKKMQRELCPCILSLDVNCGKERSFLKE